MSLPPKKPKVRSGIQRGPVPFRSQRHLKFVRSFVCCRCQSGDRRIEAAHVRYRTDGAASVKPSDYWTVPLCDECHGKQHGLGEITFWKLAGIDPYKLALEIARTSPDIATRDAARGAQPRF